MKDNNNSTLVLNLIPEHTLPISRYNPKAFITDATAEHKNVQDAFQSLGEVENKDLENKHRIQEAIEQTAANTLDVNAQLLETNKLLEDANNRLEQVIDNQNNCIKKQKEELEIQNGQLVILQSQLTVQNNQLKIQKSQLDKLSNIFASDENAVQYEKEIIQLLQGQIDENHPLFEYVKDKGGDIAVAGVTAGIPILFNAFKAFMLSKGITF